MIIKVQNTIYNLKSSNNVPKTITDSMTFDSGQRGVTQNEQLTFNQALQKQNETPLLVTH